MQAVIFDFDGVIHDTLEDLHRVHCETLENLTLEEMKEKVFGGNSREYFEKFPEQQKRNFEKAWQEYYKDLKIERTIKEELQNLSEKYLLFIISSNNEFNLNTYFENNNFMNIFKGVYGVETHISKVEKFRILFQTYNLEVDDCIFVTDTLGDIQEANKVGIKSIAVDFGYHDRQKLRQGNPFEIVSNFRDIREIIDNL